MYSISTRLHGIAFQSLVILGVLSIACHLSSRYLLLKPDLKTEFKVDSIPQFYYEHRGMAYKPNWDNLQAMVTFKVTGLQSFNNWNLKLMFVYLVADFDNDNGVNSQIVWDRIIQRKDYKIPDDIILSRQQLKYTIRDVYKSLRGKTIRVSLWIDFMPIFGVISRNKYAEWSFQAPAEYTHEQK